MGKPGSSVSFWECAAQDLKDTAQTWCGSLQDLPICRLNFAPVQQERNSALSTSPSMPRSFSNALTWSEPIAQPRQWGLQRQWHRYSDAAGGKVYSTCPQELWDVTSPTLLGLCVDKYGSPGRPACHRKKEDWRLSSKDSKLQATVTSAHRGGEKNSGLTSLTKVTIYTRHS